MSRHDDHVSVRQMLENARKATTFMQGKSRRDLDDDEMLSLAIVRLLEVLGEAARRVSIEYRDRTSQIPWRQITGTRDRLVHAYDTVNYNIVFAIVKDELPPLIADLERLVSNPPE
jgi:uncharacterized protein with HEPN domain